MKWVSIIVTAIGLAMSLITFVKYSYELTLLSLMIFGIGALSLIERSHKKRNERETGLDQRA